MRVCFAILTRASICVRSVSSVAVDTCSVRSASLSVFSSRSRHGSATDRCSVRRGRQGSTPEKRAALVRVRVGSLYQVWNTANAGIRIPSWSVICNCAPGALHPHDHPTSAWASPGQASRSSGPASSATHAPAPFSHRDLPLETQRHAPASSPIDQRAPIDG